MLKNESDHNLDVPIPSALKVLTLCVILLWCYDPEKLIINVLLPWKIKWDLPT